MFSLRSVCAIAAAATLAAFVSASPAAEPAAILNVRGIDYARNLEGVSVRATAIQSLPDILSSAKNQLLAIHTEAKNSVNAGSVTDAAAANVYVDKMADVISGAFTSAQILGGKPTSVMLGGVTNATVASDLAGILNLVVDTLQTVVGPLDDQNQSSVVSYVGSDLGILLDLLLLVLSFFLNGVLAVVSLLVAGLLGRSMSNVGLDSVNSILTHSQVNKNLLFLAPGVHM
ncbi:hypothetical protein H0H93_012335 [Arthromyces matolae]|nr:hypothetical protein H0H93_012335 [Arthromyces matolae]